MKKARVLKDFLEELRRVSIVQYACEHVGISRNTVYEWRKKDSNFRKDMDDAQKEGSDLINDMAESVLIQKIKEKDIKAVMFLLKHKHPSYADPQFRVVLPKKEEDILTDERKEQIAHAAKNWNRNKLEGEVIEEYYDDSYAVANVDVQDEVITETKEDPHKFETAYERGRRKKYYVPKKKLKE